MVVEHIFGNGLRLGLVNEIYFLRLDMTVPVTDTEPQLKLILKYVREHYHEFAEETEIRPFVIIDKAKFVPEIIIWTAVTIALIVATSWNVINTVESYNSGSTVSKVSVTMVRKMKYDKTSICFLRNTRSAKETVASFSQLNPYKNSSAFVALLQAEHTRLRSVTDNFAKNCKSVECFSADYNKLLVHLNSSLLQNGQLQIAWLIARLFNEVENNFYPVDADLTPMLSLMNDHKYLWQAINNQYTISQFRRLIASLICYRMGIFTTIRYRFHNRTKWNSFVVKNPCSIENISWSGITLNDNENEFICARTDAHHWLHFSPDAKKQAHLVYTIPQNLDFSYSAFDEVQLLFDNDLYPTLGNPNVLQLEQSALTVVLIEHIGNYCKYVASGKCTNTTTSVCAGRYTENLFQSYCSCSTTSWHSQSPVKNTPECSVQHYFNTTNDCVKKVHSSFSDLQNKTRGCLPLCNSTIYRFDMQHSDHNVLQLNGTAGTTVVELKPKSFVTYNVEEMLAMNFSEFLSELGGSLGLWINASFVVILHVVLFIVRKVVVRVSDAFVHVDMPTIYGAGGNPEFEMRGADGTNPNDDPVTVAT